MQRWVAEQDALPPENPGYAPHVWNALRAITLRPEQANVNDYGHLIFPPFSDMVAPRDPSGPSWSQLLTWVSMFQRRSQDGAIMPARQTQDVHNPKPVLAKFNLGVYHTMDFPRIRLHFVPAVVLWNPYSVPLAPTEYRLVADISPNSTHGGEFGVCFQVSHPRWEGGSRFWTPPYQMRFTVDGASDSFRFRLAPVEIPAGAAVIFTLPEHVRFDVVRNDARPGYTFWQGAIDSGVPGVVENKWIELTPGLHGGGGYSFYVEEPDMREKIIHSASTQNNRYVSNFNLWSHAGAPLYFPENPSAWPDILTDEDVGADEALRQMCFNVGGMDLNEGWRIHRSAAVMIRGLGSPRRRANYVSHTSLGQANLMLGDRDDLQASNSNPARRPWIYVRRLHQYVPKTLHNATPHFNPGVFPEIDGPPPSFNPAEPFRANSPAHSPGFPFWGLTWGLRLPDNIYEYTAATAGGDRANLEAPIAWLAHYNPTARQQARSGLGVEQGYDRRSLEFDSPANYIGGITVDPSYFDLSPHSPDDFHAFIGHSDGLGAGLISGEIPRAILYEVPRAVDEIVSVGSLAHANLQSKGNPTNGGEQGSRLTRNEWLNNAPMPTYAIGNSLQPPLLFPDRPVRSHFATTLHTGSGEPPTSSIPYSERSENNISFRVLYDQSWVLNHLLWDDFFFTPDSNSRVVWRNGVPERNFHLSATNAYIEGMFNVNSTSVDAWRALLYSFLDVDVENISGRAEARPDVERIPFTRFIRPYSPAFSPAAGDLFDEYENYAGYRRLSPAEVDALAVEIVREVRGRGPFLSLSDFVNRRLLREEDDPGGHRLQGALQAAIERAGINDSQTHPANPTTRITPDNFSGVYANTGNPIFQGYDLQAASVASNHSAPGYFTQADLLARIGSVISTRSDTFTIRAAGTTPSGARAVCEIVVRRSGMYLDPADPPERHPDEVSVLNQHFGRRFEIIRFRWLAPEEI